MKQLIIAAFLIVAGLGLGLVATLRPLALPIFLFFTLGHALIVAGIVLYLWIVWKDLKKHRVL